MKKINVFLMLLLAAGMFSACSSSGGSSNPTTTTGTTTPGTTTNPLSSTSTITGSVSAPAATLAKLQRKTFFDRFAGLFVSEVTAQVGGLQPVPNTNILAFKIDNLGNPVGDVLASITTDASGNYTLNLPAGTGLSSDLILQASALTTAQAVNTAGTLNCPAASPSLNLNPAAQVATIAVIQDIAANGGDLANFTIDEITGFVAEVQSLAATVPVGATTADAIASITSSLSSTLTTSIAAISSVGETAAPASIGGTYNLVEYGARVSLGGIERGRGKGTFTLDATNKTFTWSESFETISRTSTCAVGNSCQRTFTRTHTPEPVPETGSGTYQLSGNGKIVFTTPPSTEDPAGSVALGIINQDGTIFTLPFFEGGDYAALTIAVKEGSGLSAASVDGSTFSGHEMINEIPVNGTFTSTWTGHTTEIFTGTSTFTGSVVDGSGIGKVMTQSVTCTTAGTGCGLTATLNATTITDVAGTDLADITVSDTGLLTLTFRSDGAVDTGYISPDSNFLVNSFMDVGTPAENAVMGLGLFVKKGTGLNNTTLTGTYNVGALTEFMGTNANDEVGTLSGAVTFSETNTVSFTAFAQVADRTECVGAGSCPGTQISQGSEIFTLTGTYTVEPDGDFTMTLLDAGSTTPDIFSGTVSPDGKVIIWNTVSDNNVLEPGLFDSGRTLGIGFRQ